MTSRAIALHVGLNEVNPASYGGWPGTLYACLNDASAMADLSSSLGYQNSILTNAEATATQVLDKISQAAESLSAGDIFLLTYAGHGGQLADLDQDEIDRLDETWLLFDRELLDDELHLSFSKFKGGVRILVLSDSCHSGTVARTFYDEILADRAASRAFYEKISIPSPAKIRSSSSEARLRLAPQDVQTKVLAQQGDLYRHIRSQTPNPRSVEVQASIISISGCQDNQVSAELNGHGTFTAALLETWGNGSYTGNYKKFRDSIARIMPPTQSPQVMLSGRPWQAFEEQAPFTISSPQDVFNAGGQATPNNNSSTPVSTESDDFEIIRTRAKMILVKFQS